MADNFADKIVLSGIAPITLGSNIGATAEVGEPSQSGITNSEWWSWTAPNNGTFTISTQHSEFDTYLSVFTGSAINNLTLIDFDDDGGWDRTSLLSLNTTAGTTYQIAIDGYASFTGKIHLKIVPVIINGTPSRDTLTGSGYAETINGLAGDDRILAGDGNDTISGGDGYSYLDGGAGDDLFIGGPRSDVYIVDSVNDVIISELPASELPAPEIDEIQSSAPYTLPAEIEYLTLTGTFGASGIGNNLDNVIRGNPSNNTLNGLAGNDNLSGSSGNDTIYGGNGNDYLTGGDGIDQLIGESGNDRYDVDNVQDVIRELPSQGTDSVISGVTYTLPEGGSVENLYLRETTPINGTGNSLNNIITGNVNNNILNGGGGFDTLNGQGGQDILTDSSGGNIFGFQFGQSSIAASDHITNFTIGSDKLALGTGSTLSHLSGSFSRASNSAATTLLEVVNQVFVDANGGFAGSQPLKINSAALVVATNTPIASNYIVINDATAGFQESKDLVIKLTTTGTLPAVGYVSSVDFFINEMGF